MVGQVSQRWAAAGFCAGTRGNHEQFVVFGVDVVVEYIAGGAALRARQRCRGGVVYGFRGAVGATEGHGDLRFAAAALAVADFVAEHFAVAAVRV